MSKVLNLFKTNKKATSFSVVFGAMMILTAISAGATATADTAIVDSMTTQFDGLKATALAALAAIAGIAIALFAGIYAWRYGKKVFAIISK